MFYICIATEGGTCSYLRNPPPPFYWPSLHDSMAHSNKLVSETKLVGVGGKFKSIVLKNYSLWQWCPPTRSERGSNALVDHDFVEMPILSRLKHY